MRKLRPHDILFAPDMVTVAHYDGLHLMTDRYVCIDTDALDFDRAYVPRGQGTYRIDRKRPAAWISSQRGNAKKLAELWRQHTVPDYGPSIHWTAWSVEGFSRRTRIGTVDNSFGMVAADAHVVENLLTRGYTFDVSPVEPKPGAAHALLFTSPRSDRPAGMIQGQLLDRIADEVDDLRPLFERAS